MDKEVQDKLVVSSVTKAIKGIKVLSSLSFSVGRGECFGILGENGSGKTMLLRTMSGLAFPSSGDIKIMGYCPFRAPENTISKLGLMIGSPALYEHLSAADNIRLFSYSHLPNNGSVIDEALDEVGLLGDKNKKVGAYSRGMLQRLGVAMALMYDRPFILLDEPTQGVDDYWTQKLVDILTKRIKNGQTIILTSHNFEFVMQLCAHVMILKNGQDVYRGQLKDIAEYPYYFELSCSPGQKAIEVLQGLEYVHKIIVMEDKYELTLHRDRTHELIKTIVHSGCDIRECSLRYYSISDLIEQNQHARLKG